MEVEYGSIGNVRFLNPENVSMNDSEGNEMKCSCGNKAAGGIFGKEVSKIWCSDCDPNKNGYSAEFVYRPPAYSGPTVLDATLGFKFAKSAFLLKSFLDQNEIPYVQEELEEMYYGLAYRVKNEDGTETTPEQRLEKARASKIE